MFEVQKLTLPPRLQLHQLRCLKVFFSIVRVFFTYRARSSEFRIEGLKVCGVSVLKLLVTANTGFVEADIARRIWEKTIYPVFTYKTVIRKGQSWLCN